MNTKIPPPPVEIPHYDPRLMEYVTYRNQITERVPYKDPEVSFEIERHFLFINSIMRDRSQYPDAANYRINITEPFYDVVSIELSSGVLPNQGNIGGDAYLLLDIPELNHIVGADGTRYFGILGLQRHPNAAYYNLDKTNTNDMPVVFKPLKSRFDTLTIMLRHPDGSMVTFGNEPPDAPADLTLQSQFTFEVRTRVRKRVGIDRDARAMPLWNT